ncbi:MULTISPECIES: UDP-2,4-diacetamido-2,4,6-trideoxy-beta-L-altropyranose hydrolase [Asticcacaulis]|uniref:UDP-2,4-diacetamido-2,4, 6-trideoxy-beta-L-altropyranose hydrolase n=1 Tax=Asticcacaulis TaxID=76890 RepID=UPI001AE867AC|nr:MULTISPECIES: UDP-2,4-diacetamido-2,4,6-trideoxy-beta-L-altropyranose hydrolase [Asticcacaulis]MBP2160972.1 UDP-2,4-diacetamido-2,4,6-trideoxy-beta-L-altropyranose hydrolase [Asticcacaulis solisilvae]MDR6802017.1 UDP-2,4-diacetamido-2,4,6-trideoxy-beta-L-altropyranose hydrolase [Asticcacaulis sp. BE141]
MARLFIRTEASAQIGMGHFMRCFAVAEDARGRDIAVTFLVSEEVPAISHRAATIGAVVQVIRTPLGQDADAIAACGIASQDWLIIDSYKATQAYHSQLHALARLAVVDDLNAFDAYDCDLLINAAEAAFDMGYGNKTHAGLLLGADYAMIRREFLIPHKPVTDGPFIAVMFGGSDPGGLTVVVAERLHYAFPDMKVRVIAGPANAHIGLLQETARFLPNIEGLVDPASVAEVLAGATLVVTAAGGSVGEVAAMALPALVLVVYDNQAAALQACPFPVIDVRKGLPDDLEAHVAALLDDADGLKAIAARGHAIVDGKGAQRIVEAMFGA